MEKLTDLRHLLQHEVEDLISAEDQILSALSKMIDKAGDDALKKSLTQHLKVTEAQRSRLDTVKQLMQQSEESSEEKKSLLARLFTSHHRCKGMQGIIEEGEKLMRENMNADVMDAAIIACAQKVEHYEICGYGIARAYAEELGLTEVESLLRQTLDEEYEADQKLTHLAVGRLNKEAEKADKPRGSRSAEPASAPSPTANRKSAARQPVAGGKTSNAAKSGGSTTNVPTSRTTGSRSNATATERSAAAGRKTVKASAGRSKK